MGNEDPYVEERLGNMFKSFISEWLRYPIIV